jgi:hypothetical protein
MTVLCPACGQPARRPRVMCACGHPETSHDINRAGNRTRCFHYSPAGRCPCQAFTHDVPAPGGAAKEGTT